jgi:uncharacterized surface protein with fasciclin (FAS1) repeats
MHKLAAAGSLAALVLAVSACGGPAPSGPAYTPPAQAADNPAVATQDGVTTPQQVFGQACSQLPQGDAPGSVVSMSSQPAPAAIAANPALSTFNDMINKAGLTGQLNYNKDMTIFAPNNDAWTKFQQQLGPQAYDAIVNSKAELARLIQYQYVVHRYDDTGLANTGSVASMQGATLKITGVKDSLSVSDNVQQTAKVLCGNIPTRNATVFITDTVLQPDYAGADVVATNPGHQ